MSLNFLALATRTSWPHSSSKRLTQGEWVPTSMAILREYSESKHRLRASGVVRSIPSSMTSPLSVSIRQRRLYLSPRSSPAVIFGCSLLPSISRADPPSHFGPLKSPLNICRPTGYCVLGGRPSHLIFGEHPFCSTLAITLHGKQHQLAAPRSPTRLLPRRLPVPTRKNSSLSPQLLTNHYQSVRERRIPFIVPSRSPPGFGNLFPLSVVDQSDERKRAPIVPERSSVSLTPTTFGSQIPTAGTSR